MPLPTVDDVRPILRDFEQRIVTVLNDSWTEWLHIPDRARFSDRSRASMVFDFIKQRAMAEFDGDPNIRIIPKGQTVHFLFRDTILIRFKKANRFGLGSNIETQAVLEFVDPQMNIPALLPEVYRVEVCYHLDALATRISELAVTARANDKKIWSYALEKPVGAKVIPLPASSNPPDLSPPIIVPRRRNTAHDKTESTE